MSRITLNSDERRAAGQLGVTRTQAKISKLAADYGVNFNERVASDEDVIAAFEEVAKRLQLSPRERSYVLEAVHKALDGAGADE